MATGTILFKRGKAKDWAITNPILLEGEPGYETDTGKLKIGNGINNWNDLEYLMGNSNEIYDEIIGTGVIE